MKITSNLILPIIITLIQIFDLAIHLLTGQIEIIRIVSNLVIFGLVYLLYTNIIIGKKAFWGLAAYLLLNIYFILENGYVNPNTNSLRLPLLVFLFATLFTTTILILKSGKIKNT